MMDDECSNEFEVAHQRGLRRGFDLGWSYKGRFDRTLIEDLCKDIPGDEAVMVDKKKFTEEIVEHLQSHDSNREFITYN